MHPSFDEQWGGIHLLARVHSAAMNTGVQIARQDSVLDSFGCLPRSGIARLHGHSSLRKEAPQARRQGTSAASAGGEPGQRAGIPTGDWEEGLLTPSLAAGGRDGSRGCLHRSCVSRASWKAQSGAGGTVPRKLGAAGKGTQEPMETANNCWKTGDFNGVTSAHTTVTGRCLLTK